MNKNSGGAMSEDIKLPVLSSESSFQKYLQEVNKIPVLSSEEEFMLAKNYLEKHDLEAAHKLVTSHLKLVAKIALSYRGYGLPLNELVSEGNLGLMHAVKKFDPDRGYRLSTYSMWWIKAAIQEYILRSWSLVKMGTTAAQKKLFFSLGKIKNKIKNVHSRNVNCSDYKQIAKELGVSESEVSDMNKRLSMSDTSLNNTIGGEDDNNELIEFLPETRPNQEIMLANSEDSNNKKALLGEALDKLKQREHAILSARRLQESPQTLEDLSQKYNISKERVRQIENKAFEKIQSYMLENAGEGANAASAANA